jgi:hypothetical protein
MAGESGGGKVQAFATIVTTLLAVAAFIQSLSTRQVGASTQTASRKSYGAVGEKIEQLGQTSEQQSAAIEKLWEAVSNIQSRPPASAPIAAVEPTPTPTPHHPHGHVQPATAEKAPLPAPAPPPATPSGAKPLGQLQLPHLVEKRLPSYDDLEK